LGLVETLLHRTKSANIRLGHALEVDRYSVPTASENRLHPKVEVRTDN